MEFSNKKFLITGATGLIGKAVVKKLLDNGAYIIAAVRSIEKAKAIFGSSDQMSFIETDVAEIPVQAYEIDYIIHGAANTSSKAFVEDPVSIISTSYEGTRRLLEIARLSNVSSFVFLSTMEVYGTPLTDDKIDELHGTDLNTMAVRSSYPEVKRLCENMCACYVKQYGVPAKVIRLIQTFGEGVKYNDGRVFAEFARCAIEGRDIVLKTKGETKRSYLYTEDAISAILTVLQKGKSGEAYNAANESTYCSIYEMAKLVADECCGGKIKVQIEESDISSLGYAPTLHMNLDTRKLQGLGWQPSIGLKEMFDRLIADMKKE